MASNKFQPFSFKTLDDFLEHLTEDELEIVQVLRELIFECIPEVKEKLSYNVPFYSKHKRICFIWPASVPWGNHKQEGVRLGFANGNLMNDDIGYLDKGERKQVYTKDFMSVKEIDVDIVRAYLFEAALIDEQIKRQKG